MRNTRKNRQIIAEHVDNVWGELLGGIYAKWPDMTPGLRTWCIEFMNQDREYRHNMLIGHVELAEHAKRRKAMLVNKGY